MIRAAREDDFEAIAAITNHYVATTAIHFAYEPVAPGQLREAWRAGRERYPWLVADSAGVIGYARSGTWRERDAYAWTVEVGLYVGFSHHRKGLGRALYQALLAELERLGFHSVIAGITLPNEASVRLHRDVGFESVGVVRDAGYKFERWHDVEFWQKLLGR